jgi:hypothetical protein
MYASLSDEHKTDMWLAYTRYQLSTRTTQDITEELVSAGWAVEQAMRLIACPIPLPNRHLGQDATRGGGLGG